MTFNGWYATKHNQTTKQLILQIPWIKFVCSIITKCFPGETQYLVELS